MKAQIKTSYILSLLLPFLLICLLQNHVSAQGFLKKFLSNSLIKEGKQLKSDGDYPSAIAKFTKSIKRSPENLEAYYQLGLIFEEVMHDYDKAISLYNNAISLSEGIKPVGAEEEVNAFNSLITNSNMSIDRAIKEKFESIEKPKIPVYIMVKPYQKILKEPKMLSYNLHKTTSFTSEFKLLNFSNNWYEVNVPSAGSGWVNGKNVLKIIQKQENIIDTSLSGKAALYQRFADQYPDSSFAQNARDKADDIYYGLANEEGSINSYSMYLKNNPDGKYSKKVQLKKDELTFKDESFLNNINRLKHWISNNPESIFIEKARKRIEVLTFAQAKYDNNIVSLKGYIIDYPDGKFVSEATQLIEEIKYNHAKLIDTVVSYKKYLDEYPDGKYAKGAAKRIDERKFSALLDCLDIELLTEHLIEETDNERIELVKNRIEELSFNIASKTDTKDSYLNFIKEYPQSKYYKEAIDSIEVLDFNVVLAEDTPESFKKFISTYPDGEFIPHARNRIEELAFKDAKTQNTTNAYKKFVAEYPDSHLAITANNIIEAGYFESASQKGTIEAYKEYVEIYPDGSHLEKARLIIDMLTFKPYEEEGSVHGLKKFIKKHPDNRYVEDARARIDQLNFEYYQQKNTLKAYKKFVNKYPENRFANEAKQKILQLQTLNIGIESDSGFPYLLTIILFTGVGIGIAGVLITRTWRQGDWSCECGMKHNKDVEVCSVCGNTKPNINKASLIGCTIWFREKIYTMYGKLPEKEVITQKVKDMQTKATTTVGKMEEYHDKLEQERKKKYQKVENEAASSESFTKDEFRNKPVEDKAVIPNKLTSTNRISVTAYFMAFFFPFFYFFSRTRRTAGIVSLVVCIISIPLIFLAGIGFLSYMSMTIWAIWNLRYELMQEYTTMQAEAMAKKLIEIKEKGN